MEDEEMFYEPSEPVVITPSHETIPITEEYSQDFMRWRLEFKDVLLEFYYYLTGRPIKLAEGEELKAKRILSDEAAQSLLAFLRHFLNKSVVLSNLTLLDISVLMSKFVYTLSEWLINNSQRYQIPVEDWPTIFTGAFSIVYTTLKRAFLGGEREAIQKTVTVTETIERTEEKEEEKKPWFLLRR